VDYVVHANYTALHAGPLYAAIVGDAVVKTVNPAASVRTTLFPLPLTAAQNTVVRLMCTLTRPLSSPYLAPI